MDRLDLAIDCRLRMSTGIGRYLRELVPRVAALQLSRRLLLIGPAGDDPWVRKNFPVGVSCHPTTSRVFRSGEQALFREVLPRAKALWSPHFAVPWQLPADTRLITTIHDLIPLHVVRGWKGWLRRFGAGHFLRAARRQSSLVLTPSQAVAGQLERELNFDPSRIRVTPLGVGEEWFQTMTTRSNSKTPAPPRLLYVGNISAHKNVEGLLAASVDVMSQVPHTLSIVGEERGFTGHARLRYLMKRLGQRLQFARGLTDAQLLELYRSSSLLVQPSTEEGFGLPPLEAMAVGCPVLTSDCAALVETSGKGAHHFRLADPEDLTRQLTLLLTDDDLRMSRIEAGRDWAHSFTWDRTAQLTAAALTEMLDASRS